MNENRPLNPLWLLLGFLRPFAAQVALSVLLGVAAIASSIGLLGTSAYLIAYAALHPSVAVLQVAIVGVRFFGISRAVFRYLERLVSHSVNFSLLARLRVWFYCLLEPLAPARLQNLRSADLLGRAMADIETLENFYVRAVAPPLVALIITLGVSAFVGRYDPRLGLLLAGALLISGAGLPLLVHLLAQKPGRAVVEQRAALNAVVLDSLQGMPDLLAFGRGSDQLAQISSTSRDLHHEQARLAQIGALGSALGVLVTGLTLWGVLMLSIPQVRAPLTGGLDGIGLAVLVLVTLASFEAVTPLTQAAQNLESSLQAARRLAQLVGVSPQVTAPDQPRECPPGPPALRIHGLSFAYHPDSTPALCNLDLDLQPGKHVALVGASGAGKTTLFNLLLRFWEYDQGEIELNGIPIRCLDPEAVRGQMALIAQSTYLFAGTLRQNVSLARPGASLEEVERVIQQAQLEDLVARLPEGLNTWVGERGLQLSGGERQRVAVARALLRNAPILLLDEPTSNLDAAAEQCLLQTLRQVGQGRSVIQITHRLVGLEDMDEILVLREGRVVERGTQAALIAAGGLYAQMWQIQQQVWD